MINIIKEKIINIIVDIIITDYRGLAIKNDENVYAEGESKTNHLILIDKEGFYNEFIIGSGLLADTFLIQNENIKNIKDFNLIDLIILLIKLYKVSKKITLVEIETLFRESKNKEEIAALELNSQFLNEKLPMIKEVKRKLNKNN